MHDGTRKGNDLAKRLALYGGETLLAVGELPDTKEGRHVKDQLMRSGTAPGAHYAEARRAQSLADFIHKLALAAKEAGESLHWLRSSIHGGLLRPTWSPLVAEGEQLLAILAASLHTARKRDDDT